MSWLERKAKNAQRNKCQIGSVVMDIKHYYVQKGKGDFLILLHGNGENSEYFVHQIEVFSEKYTVVAVDTRGHGKTPRGTTPFTIRQFADDLKAFMDGMGVTKANILGFSDGANIAIIFALRYPDMVDKLILNGGNLNGKGVKARVQFPIIVGYKFASMFAKKSDDARKNAEMLGLMVNDPDIKSEDLKAIRAKTLVIAGTRDMIKTSHTKMIAENIPDSTLKIIEGDHFVANKNYQEFNEAVMDFLR